MSIPNWFLFPKNFSPLKFLNEKLLFFTYPKIKTKIPINFHILSSENLGLYIEKIADCARGDQINFFFYFDYFAMIAGGCLAQIDAWLSVKKLRKNEDHKGELKQKLVQFLAKFFFLCSNKN